MTDHSNIEPIERNQRQPMPIDRPLPAIADEDSDRGPDWGRALGAVRRYRWLVLAVIVLGFAATLVVTHRLDPHYSASTTIWIGGNNESTRLANDLGPIQHGELLDSDAWVDLLRSYVILDPVVTDLQLYVSGRTPGDSTLLRSLAVTDAARPATYVLESSSGGAYTLSLKKGGTLLERGTAGDSIGARLGLRWKPPRDLLLTDRRIEFTIVSPREAAERLADQLDAHIDHSETFLRVDLAGADPVRIARTVNAVAYRYVNVASDLKRRRLTEFTRILGDQLTTARLTLDTAERALEAFRTRTLGLPTDLTDQSPGRSDATPSATSLLAMSSELDRVKHDRQAIDQWLAVAPDARSLSGPLLLAAGREAGEFTQALSELTQKRADLRALKYRYEDAYPAVKRVEDDIATLQRETIPGLARRLSADLGVRERDLQTRANSQTEELRAVPARMVDQVRLQRAATIAGELYATLQQRVQEARLAEASSLPDVRVLDAAAVPHTPTSDAAPRLRLFGCAVSIALALVLATILDRIDPRVRYPTEVSHSLGLTILGAVPHLRARRADGSLTPEASEEVTEALRGIRVALTHTAGARRPVRLTLSSPGPGDGKSFVVANLGVSFALAGFRTLIIDGDIRRGVLHRAFNAQRRPGLTDYLRGDTALRSIVQTTAFPQLAIIGCGTRSRLAPELLGGAKMSAALAELEKDYDVILCDSPPLGAGVDPLVLGSVTGQMLLVLRTGVSLRSVVEAKLVVLDRLPVHILGAVLNDVPPGDLFRPYAYYLPGYQAADELEPVPSLPSV